MQTNNLDISKLLSQKSKKSFNFDEKEINNITYIIKKVNGKYQICVMDKRNSNKKRKKIKTRKGKISNNASKIAVFIALSFILLSHTKKIIANQKNISKIEIEKDNWNTSMSINLNEMMQLATEEITKNRNCQEQVISYQIEQSNFMGKRKETKELYGEIIEKYSKRYGLPSCIVESLITQERHEKDSCNPGQLTRMICGETVWLPIIQTDEIGYENKNQIEKIYIVRDEPKKENFLKEEDYIKQLNRYKEQLEQSKKLAEEGYEIIYFETLLNNQYQNIRVSTMWLAHCIYKCDCKINKGIFGYNQGYPEAKKATDNEIMNGLAGDEKADLWYNYNVYRYLTKEEAEKMNFTLKPFPEYWDYFTENQKKEYIETEQNTYQTYSLSLPIFNESLEDNYTYEKETRPHL